MEPYMYPHTPSTSLYSLMLIHAIQASYSLAIVQRKPNSVSSVYIK